jgi:hypothetical protein
LASGESIVLVLIGWESSEVGVERLVSLLAGGWCGKAREQRTEEEGRKEDERARASRSARPGSCGRLSPFPDTFKSRGRATGMTTGRRRKFEPAQILPAQPG